MRRSIAKDVGQSLTGYIMYMQASHNASVSGVGEGEGKRMEAGSAIQLHRYYNVTQLLECARLVSSTETLYQKNWGLKHA